MNLAVDDRPQLVINASHSFLTIRDLQDLYLQKYNARVDYHAIYMAIIRGRIEHTDISGRKLIPSKAAAKALDYLKARRRHKDARYA